jgi:hypothetical protein
LSILCLVLMYIDVVKIKVLPNPAVYDRGIIGAFA